MSADLLVDQYADAQTVVGFGPTDQCADARGKIARDHCEPGVRLRWYYDGGAQNTQCSFKVYKRASITAYAYPAVIKM